MNENYHGLEGFPPTGSRVTIDCDLALVPAASSLSQRWLSAGCRLMTRNKGDDWNAIPLE